MTPELVLFDLGGVCLTNGWDHESRGRAAAAFSLDPDFEARHAALAADLDCARITLAAYLDRVVFDRPRAFSPADFVAFMHAESKAFPDTLAIVDELQRSGRWLVAALNNESIELNQYRIDRFELRRYFRLFLSSCYLGVRKPDEACYRRALQILQRPPEACVFIDDRAENLAPAARLGIRTIHHRDAETTRDVLRAYGI